MAAYKMFQNPWEENERFERKARMDISHLANKFIKMFKLQKHRNKYRKLDRCVIYVILYFLIDLSFFLSFFL